MPDRLHESLRERNDASRARAPRVGTRVVTFLLLALAGCASTGFRSTWAEPSASSITLSGRKVAAFASGIYEPMRRTAEDTLAGELTARGAQGIAGYTVLSAREARNPAAARQKLQNAGVEGTVALRIVARVEQITNFPPTFWGYWGVDWPSPSPVPAHAVVVATRREAVGDRDHVSQAHEATTPVAHVPSAAYHARTAVHPDHRREWAGALGPYNLDRNLRNLGSRGSVSQVRAHASLNREAGDAQ